MDTQLAQSTDTEIDTNINKIRELLGMSLRGFCKTVQSAF